MQAIARRFHPLCIRFSHGMPGRRMVSSNHAALLELNPPAKR